MKILQNATLEVKQLSKYTQSVCKKPKFCSIHLSRPALQSIFFLTTYFYQDFSEITSAAPVLNIISDGHWAFTLSKCLKALQFFSSLADT